MSADDRDGLAPDAPPIAEGGGDGRGVLLAFAGLIVIGGGNAVAIRYSVRHLDPYWAAFVRFAPTVLLLFPAMLIGGIRLSRGRALVGDIVYGALFFGFGFGFLSEGIHEVGAGTAQVAFASIPLVTLLLAAVHGVERVTRRSVLGAILAVVGFALVFGRRQDASPGVMGILALLAGSIAIAEALVVVKWFPRTHTLVKNVVGMASGSCVILLLSLLFGERHMMPTDPTTWIALAYLVLVGSIVISTLHLFVLQRWSASATSYQFVLFPFVTVGLSAWLLDEAVTWTLAIGAVLVLCGVYLGALSRRGRPSPGGAAGGPPTR